MRRLKGVKWKVKYNILQRNNIINNFSLERGKRNCGHCTDLSAGKRRAEAGLVVRERSLVEAFTAIVTDSCSCTDSNSATQDRSETWALTQYSVF